MAAFIAIEAILHKNIILSIQDISPNLLLEKVIAQLMDCQVFPPFSGTKYSNFLHFQRHCGCSVIYDKESIDWIYDYIETSMDPAILMTETNPTNTLSP